ncbi:MAG: alpha/beta fold hydrolase [Spirochaetaceae bacterium]|nr:alpha/beta fold hydrolase [Spirochaetaceae bacterium]HPE90140.1 alpha/beta fold hydrolase [Spirochaetales bacterium]
MNDSGLPGHGPSTIPIFMRRPGASDAVLLVHGYTGFPGELGYVAEALFRAGHTVYAPRLPGHGTDRADFMATGARDWIRRARDAYLELASEYGRVRVVGHSMGGAIAVILAADYAPDRVALLAPAVDIADRRLALAPLLGRIAPVIRQGLAPSPEDAEGERLRLHEEYRKDLLVRQAGELTRVVRRARAALPRVRSRLLVVSGELDETVPASAAARISATALQSPEIRLETLKGAGHLFPFLAEGRHDCARLVEEWFSE